MVPNVANVVREEVEIEAGVFLKCHQMLDEPILFASLVAPVRYRRGLLCVLSLLDGIAQLSNSFRASNTPVFGWVSTVSLDSVLKRRRGGYYSVA